MTCSTTNVLLAAIESHSQTSESLTKACLSRIAAKNDRVGAFLRTLDDEALATARAIDEKRKAGKPLGALAGIPVAIKDNIHIEGALTTCASKMLEDFRAPFDATVIARLKAADAILIGKTNLDEFAMGSSTEYSAFQATRNPHDPAKVAGGSSGGSAVAVAADMVPLALGSSTGGSIRQPASFCGVVGLKPTYGRVSRYGLVAFGSSLDQIGPMAKDVDGVARLYQAIAGKDPKDATCSDEPVIDCLHDLTQPPETPVIGLPREYFTEDIQPAIKTAINELVKKLEAAGAVFKEISLPHTEYAIPAYYLIATAEASSNLARFDGARYGFRTDQARDLSEMYTKTRTQGFGMEVKRRIILGTYCLSSGYYEGYYLQAQKVRTRIIETFREAFTQVDAILTPTTPQVAFPLGEKTDDPMAMYLSDIFTVTANLAGIPAISLPCGKDEQGLPIGVQLLGNHFQEARLLALAAHCERLCEHEG